MRLRGPAHLIVFLLSATLLFTAAACSADAFWTDDDEDAGKRGYQETAIWSSGIFVQVDGPDRQNSVAFVESTIKEVNSNAIWFRYRFVTGALGDEIAFMDVYQDVSHTILDVSLQSYLNFWVRGSVDGQAMCVALVDQAENEGEWLVVNDYVSNDQTISSSKYRLVTIPIGDMDNGALDLETVQIVSFSVTAEEETARNIWRDLYVDYIYFSDLPLAVRWPR